MTWLPEWLIIAVSLAALLWPIPWIAALAEDWVDRRKHERTRRHIEEMESLDTPAPWEPPRH